VKKGGREKAIKRRKIVKRGLDNVRVNLEARVTSYITNYIDVIRTYGHG